jgi:hypothetical protein
MQTANVEEQKDQASISELVDNVETQATEQEEKSEAPAKREYTEVEQKAIDEGWDPKYEGEDFRSAKEYLSQRELRNKIHDLNKQLKGYKKSMENVEDLIRRREEFAAKKAVEELMQSRREAIQNGDVETVEKLDQQISSAKQEIEKVSPAQPKASDEVLDWVNRHKTNWFNDSKPENLRMMREAADIEVWHKNKYPDASEMERLHYIESEIKRTYPHRFSQSSRERAPDVEGSSEVSRVKKKMKYDSSKITPSLRQVARDFVKKGIFKTEEAYYESYFGA